MSAPADSPQRWSRKCAGPLRNLFGTETRDERVAAACRAVDCIPAARVAVVGRRPWTHARLGPRRSPSPVTRPPRIGWTPFHACLGWERASTVLVVGAAVSESVRVQRPWRAGGLQPARQLPSPLKGPRSRQGAIAAL